MKARIPNQNQTSRADMMAKIQKMQEDMENTRIEVEQTEFTACSGGGAVEVTVNGAHEVKSIKLNPEVVDPEDVEMLEDLLLASLNEAIRKANDTMEQKVNAISGGLNIPGLGF